MGAPKKVITKEMVLAAMAKTKSNRAAARYLNVSYIHFKKYAQLYKDKENGQSLFELHKNQAGKGIPKFLKSKGKEPALVDIIEGRIDASNFTPEKIKYRLITEGHLEECCHKCGFEERRVLDYKMPLLLHFKDNNKKNYRRENIELLVIIVISYLLEKYLIKKISNTLRTMFLSIKLLVHLHLRLMITI